MKNTSLKEKLKKNELTMGTWISIGHPAVVEILSTAGFDWLTIDMEHNSIDNSMMQILISTIQSKDKAALVRVSKNEEVAIKHALDAGADGIIVPLVKSGKDAKQAVDFVKYPPEGKRGVGLSRAQKYGVGFEEYKDWLDKSVVIIAQVEHIDAVHHLTEIISTPGIDAIIIGPYDLSGSLGYPGDYDRPEVISALKRVEDICLERNFPMGYHIVPPNLDLLKSTLKKGYKFIAMSTDFNFMGENARNIMNGIKMK